MPADRYARMPYRRCGRTGLLLPAVSLGLWQGMGGYVDPSQARALCRRAFDLGITHFDLANNYGHPPGASESLFAGILRDLPRHEVLVSTKAGYRMWPGPYGDGGSRKYLIESCEQSLRRLGVDHVDIFYHHRPDPHTPLEETMAAIDHLVRSGKALYAGLSNYPDPRLSQALGVIELNRWTPIAIHQPRASLLDRRAFTEVLPTAAARGLGVIVYSPLEQGILAGRYRSGVPADARAARALGNGGLDAAAVDRQAAKVEAARRLEPIARARGQSSAQLALGWLLADERITSVLIGASTIAQLEDNLGCLDNPSFTAEELRAIDAACAGA